MLQLALLPTVNSTNKLRKKAVPFEKICESRKAYIICSSNYNRTNIHLHAPRSVNDPKAGALVINNSQLSTPLLFLVALRVVVVRSKEDEHEGTNS
jgi:hypothetical protein